MIVTIIVEAHAKALWWEYAQYCWTHWEAWDLSERGRKYWKRLRQKSDGVHEGRRGGVGDIAGVIVSSGSMKGEGDF